MKPKFLAFPLALVLSQSIVAADFTWQGNTDASWTEGTNWLLGAAPTYGATLTTDRLYLGSAGVGAGAVYNPGVGVTTTFESGRGIIIGSAQGPANLTVSSGTLKINGPATAGNEPIMANGVNATLLINGGHLDLSGHGNGFKLVNTGVALLTSDLTITSGAFSSGTFDFFNGGVAATSTVNLDGGVLTVTRFLKTGTTATSTLNLDGGTLQLRSTLTSPALFLADLAGLQTIVEDGGVIVDTDTLTNAYSATIAEVLEHDTVLGLTADGGLTKNGAGTLTVSGANTFTGPVTVNAGTSTTTSRLLLGNDSGAGTGTITLADSYTDLQLSVNRNIANPLVVSDTGDQKTLIFNSPSGAEYSGPITVNETTVDNFRIRSDASCFLTISGKISGAGKITKFQSGDVSLTNGANDFSGGTKIDTGKLNFLYGALGTSGSVTMNGGTLRWSPGNTQDLSARLVMVDAKTATTKPAATTSPSAPPSAAHPPPIWRKQVPASSPSPARTPTPAPPPSTAAPCGWMARSTQPARFP
jgi:autotransporter-associated beta strand protein